MENIKIIDGEIYETHDVKSTLTCLNFKVEEMQKALTISKIMLMRSNKRYWTLKRI